MASENPNIIIIFFISVKWTFNGDEIGDTETLTIKEITEDNIGTYACNVSNRAGNLLKLPIFYLIKNILKKLHVIL